MFLICNAAIEGLNGTTSLTPSVKQQLLGEAKFMRAFFYFYLVNLFGDVPLATSTDWQVNSFLSRTPKQCGLSTDHHRSQRCAGTTFRWIYRFEWN